MYSTNDGKPYCCRRCSQPQRTTSYQPRPTGSISLGFHRCRVSSPSESPPGGLESNSPPVFPIPKRTLFVFRSFPHRTTFRKVRKVQECTRSRTRTKMRKAHGTCACVATASRTTEVPGACLLAWNRRYFWLGASCPPSSGQAICLLIARRFAATWRDGDARRICIR